MGTCLGRAEVLSVCLLLHLKGEMKNGKYLKTGDRVKFTIKDRKKNELVSMIGKVTKIMSSREAKDRRLIKSNRTSRVIEILGPDNRTYYKHQSVLNQPEEQVL